MTTGYELMDALDAAVYATDASGRLTYYNTAAARLWGRKPELGYAWSDDWRLFRPDGQPLPYDETPMALALKEGRSIHGAECIGEKPNGSRAAFIPIASPVFRDGKVDGVVNLLADPTGARDSEEHRAYLAAIVDSSDDAIVSKTLQGRVTSWNAGAERIFGYRSDEMIGESITKIIPPELHGEETEILARLGRGERIEHFDAVRVTKDGRRVDISLTISPIRNARGEIIGASKVARDVTDRKRAEEIQRLLMNELDHRIKNTLAMVDAIARQTMRRSGSAADFVSTFSGRVKSLARAHGLLTSSTFQGAEMSAIIRDQLMMNDDRERRISWSGPDVVLDAQTALHLALVMHELGTNARKYGALSVAGGSVSITWIIDMDRKLHLSWREHGGPKVTPPETMGFGTTLIEQSLKSNGGEVNIVFAERGVICDIFLPLSEQPHMTTSKQPTPRDGASANDRTYEVLTGKRVLIVEDEALIAMVSAEYVSEVGCEVIGPAATISAALRLVEEERIDAAMLDANLSGHRVTEVAEALSKKGIPFAFVTGYGREALPAAFNKAIAVEKPFSQAQLLDALAKLLTPTSHSNA